MSAARDEVLRRIALALGPGPRAAVDVPRAYRQHDDPSVSADQMVDLLVDRLVDYKALVRRALPGSGVSAAVAAAVAARGASSLVVPAGVPDAWTDGLVDVELLRDDPPLTYEQLDTADGVLTGCVVAIAETGTIVLDGRPGQGRRALTLLPDYHLCVVNVDQVVHGVPVGLGWLDPLRPMTFVSGPSATSDIELERVEGVHGPRTLEVIIVATRDASGTGRTSGEQGAGWVSPQSG